MGIIPPKMIEKEILLDEIKVLPGRTRTAKEKTSDMNLLRDSIKKLGLFHPILVNEDNELVAGFRRLTAYKMLRAEDSERFSTIKVRVLLANDEYKQLEAEIHENWARKELRGYELDTALARLKKVYQKLHPETVSGGDRKSKDFKQKKKDQTAKTPIRFEKYMADDLMQQSVSTIEKRVRVGEAIEKEVFTKKEVEAYKEGEVTHTKMLKTYETRKKLTKQLEESLEIEKKKVKKPRIHPDAPDVVWDGPQLVGDSPEAIDKVMKLHHPDYDPSEWTSDKIVDVIKRPEQYECILSVEYGVRQKIEGLTIEEVREWFITILSSDKLWKEIGEPFEMMIGIVSFTEKDKRLGI